MFFEMILIKVEVKKDAQYDDVWCDENTPLFFQQKANLSMSI